jgi:adenylate cyclase
MPSSRKIVVRGSDVAAEMNSSFKSSSKFRLSKETTDTSKICSIRAKAAIILFTILIFMFASFSIVILATFPKSFSELETSMAKDSTKRLTRVIADDFDNMFHVLIQYSKWDDTLFVMDDITTYGNDPSYYEEYLYDNFGDSFMSTIGLNLAAFYYDNGTIAFGRGIGDTPIPEQLLQLNATDSLMMHNEDPTIKRGGLMEIDGQILMLVSGPIQLTQYDLDSRTNGAAIFGRYISPKNILNYAVSTRICVQLLLFSNISDPYTKEIHNWASSAHPIGIDVSESTWKYNAPFSIKPLTSKQMYESRQCWGTLPSTTIDSPRIAAYAVLPDLWGDKVSLLITDIDRQIHKLEVSSLVVCFVMLLVLAVSVLVIVALFIECGVLRPVFALVRTVKYIAMENDISVRMSTKSRDELGTMARGINVMLDSLEKALLELKHQKEESERLLLNMLPEVISTRLKLSGAVKEMEERAVESPEQQYYHDLDDNFIDDQKYSIDNALIADTFPEVSVIFSDLVGFADLASTLDSTSVLRLLNTIFTAYDKVCARNGVEKIKTIGDVFMAVSGAPVPCSDHADRAVQQALQMFNALDRVKLKFKQDLNIQVRVGINSGAVVAGVIGTTKYVYDIFGDTVNVASRMESHGLAGHIHISESTYSLLTTIYPFKDRGLIAIKGKEDMRTYLLNPDDFQSEIISTGTDMSETSSIYTLVKAHNKVTPL